MKKAYTVLLVALSIIVLSWFLPWLYWIIFPVGGSDPFIAYSPVSGQMIVSEMGDEKVPLIYALDSEGGRQPGTFTREERDSLLPQIYYTQLMAREALPDTIAGVEVSVPAFKHSQWVFSSIPRDINKVHPEVYMIMESMPARVDLEDPTEVFRFRDGQVQFIDMETNAVNESRSKRFTDIFNDRGFKLPVKSFSANITSRKPYDEGYLMADAAGDLYHLKMQAGRPYLMKVIKPDSVSVAHVFVMENVDNRHLGFMTDDNDNLYIIEREGYRIVPLAVGKVDPEKDRISVVKNLFNMIVKITSPEGVRWTAIDSDDYSRLAGYTAPYNESLTEKIASYIFPYELSFTSVSDCYASPRVEVISWRALFLNAVLALAVFIVVRRRQESTVAGSLAAVIVTFMFGIFAFIPMMLIKN